MDKGLSDACVVMDDGMWEPNTCSFKPGTWILPPDLSQGLNEFLARAELYPELAEAVIAEHDKYWEAAISAAVDVNSSRELVRQMELQAEIDSMWTTFDVVLIVAGGVCLGAIAGAVFGGVLVASNSL